MYVNLKMNKNFRLKRVQYYISDENLTFILSRFIRGNIICSIIYILRMFYFYYTEVTILNVLFYHIPEMFYFRLTIFIEYFY